MCHSMIGTLLQSLKVQNSLNAEQGLVWRIPFVMRVSVVYWCVFDCACT